MQAAVEDDDDDAIAPSQGGQSSWQVFMQNFGLSNYEFIAQFTTSWKHNIFTSLA